MGQTLIIKGADFSSVAIDKIAPVVSITATVSPSGGGVVKGTGLYPVGETATLVATPNENYKFKQWSDGNKNATRSITVGTISKRYVAIFESSNITVLYSSLDGNYGSNVNRNLPFYTNKDVMASIVNKTINYVKIKLSSTASNNIGRYVAVKKCDNTPNLSTIASKQLTQEDITNGYMTISFEDTIIENGYYIGVGDRDVNDASATSTSVPGFVAYNRTGSTGLYIIGGGFVFKELVGQMAIEVGIVE